MKILFREPLNKPLKLMKIENKLKPIQELIGGYLQVVKIRKDILCIYDEEGLLKGLDNNYFNDEYGWIVGNVVFCGEDGAEFTSLTNEQIKFIEDYIGCPIV
jgi:hypothetical protein